MAQGKDDRVKLKLNFFNKVFNPFQPSVAFLLETSHLICWFLYVMQHWAEMDLFVRFLMDLLPF